MTTLGTEGNELVETSNVKQDGNVKHKGAPKRGYIALIVIIMLLAVAGAVTGAVLGTKGKNNKEVPAYVEPIESSNDGSGGSCDKINTGQGCKSCEQHIPGCVSCSESTDQSGPSILGSSGQETGKYLNCDVCSGNQFYANGFCSVNNKPTISINFCS